MKFKGTSYTFLNFDKRVKMEQERAKDVIDNEKLIYNQIMSEIGFQLIPKITNHQ